MAEMKILIIHNDYQQPGGETVAVKAQMSLLHRDRWPARILDYLAAGKLVVTNWVSKVLDLFTRREVGVFAPYDIEAMVEAIVAFLRDLEQRIHLGQRACQAM